MHKHKLLHPQHCSISFPLPKQSGYGLWPCVTVLLVSAALWQLVESIGQKVLQPSYLQALVLNTKWLQMPLEVLGSRCYLCGKQLPNWQAEEECYLSKRGPVAVYFPLKAHRVELQRLQLFVLCALSWRAPLCTLSSACAFADPFLDQIELTSCLCCC